MESTTYNNFNINQVKYLKRQTLLGLYSVSVKNISKTEQEKPRRILKGFFFIIKNIPSCETNLIFIAISLLIFINFPRVNDIFY